MAGIIVGFRRGSLEYAKFRVDNSQKASNS